MLKLHIWLLSIMMSTNVFAKDTILLSINLDPVSLKVRLMIKNLTEHDIVIDSPFPVQKEKIKKLNYKILFEGKASYLDYYGVDIAINNKPCHVAEYISKISVSSIHQIRPIIIKPNLEYIKELYLDHLYINPLDVKYILSESSGKEAPIINWSGIFVKIKFWVQILSYAGDKIDQVETETDWIKIGAN